MHKITAIYSMQNQYKVAFFFTLLFNWVFFHQSAAQKNTFEGEIEWMVYNTVADLPSVPLGQLEDQLEKLIEIQKTDAYRENVEMRNSIDQAIHAVKHQIDIWNSKSVLPKRMYKAWIKKNKAKVQELGADKLDFIIIDLKKLKRLKVLPYDSIVLVSTIKRKSVTEVERTNLSESINLFGFTCTKTKVRCNDRRYEVTQTTEINLSSPLLCTLYSTELDILPVEGAPIQVIYQNMKAANWTFELTSFNKTSISKNTLKLPKGFRKAYVK